MKKTLFLAIAIFWCIASSAQKAVTIESIAANNHDTTWYAEQMAAWQKKVNENPQDQWAWRNLFCATDYYEMLSESAKDKDSSKVEDVLHRMELTIPDSYVYHLCMHRMARGDFDDHLLRAIELIPDNAYADDVSFLAARSWLHPNAVSFEKASELFRLAYQKRAVPEHIMRYNWNMLQSMDENAIYFANGDNCLIPMKMLQEALNIRKDVTIIPMSFLFLKDYSDALWEQIGINPFVYKEDFSDYAQYGQGWDDRFLKDVITHILKQAKRPTYFFSDMANMMDGDSIYNEGLLLKYSNHKYDNFAIAMNNVRNVYHLEYLAEPDLVYDAWESSDRLDMNNVGLLANLIDKFRKNGEPKEAERLYNILHACVKRCDVNPGRKEALEKTLEFWSKKQE